MNQIDSLTKIPRQDLHKQRKAWYLDAKPKWRSFVKGGGHPHEICNKGVPRGVVLEWLRELGMRPALTRTVQPPTRLPSRESLMNEYFRDTDAPGAGELLSLARIARVSCCDLVGGVIDDDE